MAYIGKSPTGSAVRSRYYYEATGGETSLSGADKNGKTLKFTDGEYVDVHLNGVRLEQGTDYGVGTANTISSLSALAANDIVEIVVYDVYNVAKINSEAMRNRWYFTATGGETSIGTSQISNLVFPANAEIDVKLNGVTLQAGTDYNTTTANTVGGLSALTAGQIIEIVYYEKFVLADTVSKASGGNFAGGINVDGNLGVGTTTPSQPLHVKGGAVRFENTQDTYLQVNTTDTHLYTAGSHPLRFGTNSTERMKINADGSWGKAPAGTVLQVVQTHLNTTSSQSITGGTRTTVNGVNATITPKSTSSKVLAMVRWHGEASTDNHHNSVWGLRRGSTDVGEAGASGSRRMGIAGLVHGYHTADASSTQDSVQFQFLDSPATTSATTYYLTTEFVNSCTLYRNRGVSDADNTAHERLTCSMILMEIAG